MALHNRQSVDHMHC